MLNLVSGAMLDKSGLRFYDHWMSIVFVQKGCQRLAADLVGVVPGAAAFRLRCLARIGFFFLPQARRSLLHYLDGRGRSLSVEMDQLLQQDAGLRTYLFAQIRDSVEGGVCSGEVFVPQRHFSSLNWRSALGSIHVGWRLGRSEVEFEFADRYGWDPDSLRVTRALHRLAVRAEASGARSFLHVGRPVVVPLRDVVSDASPRVVAPAAMYCM